MEQEQKLPHASQTHRPFGVRQRFFDEVVQMIQNVPSKEPVEIRSNTFFSQFLTWRHPIRSEYEYPTSSDEHDRNRQGREAPTPRCAVCSFRQAQCTRDRRPCCFCGYMHVETGGPKDKTVDLNLQSTSGNKSQ